MNNYRWGALKTSLMLPLLAGTLAARALGTEGIPISDNPKQPGVMLVSAHRAADICIDAGDFKVVQIAADCLSGDIECITGVKPHVRTQTIGLSPQAVFIGTIGKSALIDSLTRRGKLNVRSLKGKWESYVIATVTDPVPGVRTGLVIAGSDRRGTAYGVFTLSEAMGVSPWCWWADVPPHRHDTIVVAAGSHSDGPPSVKYRGIFINDEDWGFQPWAAKTFEPETKDIGPKTYGKVFELLLRLKANYLWPAMHPSTRAFNFYPQNKVMADDYAIVMGSSHAEPMLRDNVGEWDEKKYGAWNYKSNRDGVLGYWAERVQANRHYENVYSLGMRGIHDSPMPGPKDSAGKINILEQVFADQRALLARYINPDPAHVPQVFTPYKEVLALYQQGLRVPEDVILNWPDDNFGYIRQLPTPEEQKRPGGSGVYYHASYNGSPYDYLWLDTTPPALIWEEMSKAYDYGARSVWVLNVGDIKPAELSMDFFLRLAWNPSKFGPDSAHDFLRSWAERQFGPQHALAIAEIMETYYHLGYARKPEHMSWAMPASYNLTAHAPVARTAFSPVDYDDEASRRLADYAALTRKTEAIYTRMPAAYKDAFYELVLYPVRTADLMNQKFLNTDRSFLYAAQKRASASDYVEKARQAYAHIQEETNIYNTRIAGGKWNGIMSAAPRDLSVFHMPETGSYAPPVGAGLGVGVEGHVQVLSDAVPAPEMDALAARWGIPGDATPDTLPLFNTFTKRKHFFDVFNTGATSFDWTAQASAPWIRVSETQGHLEKEKRIWVDIDWANAPAGESVSGSITIRGAGTERVAKLQVFNPASARTASTQEFSEDNGVVSMEAEHFSRRMDRSGAGWRVISGLGRTGDSIAVLPTTTPSIGDAGRVAAQAPAIEYDFHTFGSCMARIMVYALPTFRIHPGRGLRYAVAIDEAAPVIVDLATAGRWEDGVLDATRIGSSQAETAAGKHTLKIWMIDPGVVLDKIVVDLGGVKPSYLGPPETRLAPSN